MLKKQLIALAVAGLSITSIAHAEEFLDNRWYGSAFGTYVMPDGDRHVDDGWGGGLGVGKIINQHFNVEIRGFYQNYNDYSNPVRNYDGGYLEMAGGTADLQYHFMREKLMSYGLSPYAVIGAGAMLNWTPLDNGAVSFLTEAGIGLTYELADHLLFRTDVRYRYTNDFQANLSTKIDHHHDMVVNAGVVIPFGEKPKAAVKEEPPKPVEKTCKDLDDDRDGVNNCDDKCPNTAPGAQVDATGCQIIVLKGVNFKVNSAVLTSSARMILDGVAKDLISGSEGKAIEVQGHTSSEGSDKHNMDLSQRRSESVANYLKARGVKNVLTGKGYGETMLKVVPDTSPNRKINKTLEPAREQNRRVELHWME